MSTKKRFDRDLWLENDAKARKGVESIFNSISELEIRPHKDSRKVDLEIFKNGQHVANIETEVKRVWKAKEFQYATIQFPERKKKFCELDKPTIFVMWNYDMDSYLAVASEDLLASPCVEVPNKYVFKGEKFFQVPIEKAAANNVTAILKKLNIL
jgi:hypothetical protein